MAGDNYTFKMPTEELKTLLAERDAEIAKLRDLVQRLRAHALELGADEAALPD